MRLAIKWPQGRYLPTEILDRLWSDVYASAFAAEVRAHGDVVSFSTAQDRAVEQADIAVQKLVDNKYG